MADEPSPDCFVDTNVWLYAFIESDDQDKAIKARDLIWRSRPVVSVQVINEVCVNLIRKAGFGTAQIRQLVASFYAKYTVLGLDYRTHFP